MPPKGKGKGKSKNAKAKAKEAEEAPPVKIEPPMVVTNEQLVHVNWWPVIGMVAESSPVETLLVNLMVDDVQGNSVITIKKDDLLQEANNLLKIRRTPVTAESLLSRRDQEKLARQRHQEEMLAKAKEREQREKEERERQMIMEGTLPEPPPVKPVSTKTGKATASTTGKNKKEDPVQTAPAAQANAALPKAPRTLADDLFEELELNAKGTPLDDVFREPDIRTQVLLIKYKLMLLKKHDIELYKAVKPTDERETEVKPPPPPPTSPVPVVETGTTKKGKDKKGKKGKNEEKKVNKVSVTKEAATKDGKTAPAGSIIKGGQKGAQAGGKGKGAQDAAEAMELPELEPDEVMYQPLHLSPLENNPPVKHAKARAPEEIPETIQQIKKKMRPSIEGEKSAADIVCYQKPPVLGDADYGLQQAAVDLTASPGGDGDKMHPELIKLQKLFLASVVGTEGLPPLNHALITRLALYGLPCFPTSKNQMVRYIVLQGFTNSDLLEEMRRCKAAVSCIFKIQFLRHRSKPPVKLTNLIWIRQPFEATTLLSNFWTGVGKFIDFHISEPGTQLCPLALQVKYDVNEHTTRNDYVAQAKEAGAKLGNLFFQVVKAKTLFQFYNQSLVIQKVGKIQPLPKETPEHATLNNISDFMANMAERCYAMVFQKSPPVSPAASPLPELSVNVKNFMGEMETELFQRGLLPELSQHEKAFAPHIDSQHKLQQAPRTEQQVNSLFRHLGVGPCHDCVESPVTPGLHSMLMEALRSKTFAVVYRKQYFDHLLRRLRADTAQRPTIIAQRVEHFNPLAEAMSAWRSASHKPKKLPRPPEQKMDFGLPKAEQYDANAPLLTPLNPRMKRLAKMRNYYAVVAYPPQRLLMELAKAHEQFLHHCVSYDSVSEKTYVAFYALHEKHSHSHFRKSETRLDSRADFDTFVCNIMENVQSWVDQNLHKMHRCPRRSQISPYFPYGCQSQFASQQDTAQLLRRPQFDHISDFIRKYSLKNLVRNNKELFATRCNWKLRRRPPEEEKKKTLPDEPFIWNRAKKPVAPRCTIASSHPTIAAYSVTNALSKIVREEQRVYGRDFILSVEDTEAYNGKTAAYLTVWYNDGMEILVSHSDHHGRSLVLEINEQARCSVGITPKGLDVNLLDAQGNHILFAADDLFFCEIVPAFRAKVRHGDTPEWYGYSATGKLYTVLHNEEILVTLPSGRSAVQVDREEGKNEDVFGEMQAEKREAVPLRNGLSLRCLDENKISIHVDRAGVQKSVEKIRNGFIRKVHIAPDLRFTTTKEPAGPDGPGRNHVVIEKPELPRVGIETVSQFGYVATPDGIVLITEQSGHYFLVAGSNCILFQPDGECFAGRLRTIGELMEIYGLAEVEGYITATLLDRCVSLLHAMVASTDWQASKLLIRVSLKNAHMASVYDYAGVLIHIGDNGDVIRAPEFPNADPCVLPNPRLFVLDSDSYGGTEYICGDDAVALKYKVLRHYKSDRVEVPVRKRKGAFICRVSDNPARPWSYEYPDVLPATQLSDMHYLTHHRGKTSRPPCQQTFRKPAKSSAEEREFWREITFVQEPEPVEPHCDTECQ